MTKKITLEEQIKIIESGAAYEEATGIFGLDVSEEEASLVLLPVPWDATASYGLGTRLAPEAILKASEQIDHHDLVFDKPYRKGISFLPENPRIKELNNKAHDLKKSSASEETVCKTINSYSKELNSFVEKESLRHLKSNKIVGLVGGEHSSPYGLIKALSSQHKDFGILHIDAHFDLRKSYENYEHSHASIMNNVLTNIPEVKKIVSFGIRDFVPKSLS